MRRPRDTRTRARRLAAAVLGLALLGGLTQASAARLTVDATDTVASGAASVTPACDSDVRGRLAFEQVGGVDTDRVVGLDVVDVDATACAGRTVAVTAFDAAGVPLFAASAALPPGATSVRLTAPTPLSATSVHSWVVTIP